MVSAAVLVTAGGCTSRGPTAPDSARPAAPTAWDAVRDQVQEDGSVATATALAAFALAIGPVPGAVVPGGAVEQLDSGTLAVTWVLRHWADLSPEQRTAVLAGLGASDSTNKPAAYHVGAPAAAPARDPNLSC